MGFWDKFRDIADVVTKLSTTVVEFTTTGDGKEFGGNVIEGARKAGSFAADKSEDLKAAIHKATE